MPHGSWALWNPGHLERSEGPPPLPEEAGLREQTGVTKEAGFTNYLGAHEQVAFWLLPEAT